MLNPLNLNMVPHAPLYGIDAGPGLSLFYYPVAPAKAAIGLGIAVPCIGAENPSM